MAKNSIEIHLADKETIYMEYKYIIICNNTIKQAILNNQVKLDNVEKPYVIITNKNFKDDEIHILEDVGIEECLLKYGYKIGYGGSIS